MQRSIVTVLGLGLVLVSPALADWIASGTTASSGGSLAARATPATPGPATPGPAARGPCRMRNAQDTPGGLVGMAPDALCSATRNRDQILLSGTRSSAQIGRSIEVSDAAIGPASGPGISTAANASYALSLINVRPDWSSTGLTGESDGLNIFLRQSRGDTAGLLSNVGVRDGFAATLESYTFAADVRGNAVRGVRTQLGVVNPRDGGEFGLIVQAADGAGLSAGLRIASLGSASWKNYLEAISPSGEAVATIRGSDGAIVAGDLLPTTTLRKSIGTPDHRYAATYTQVLQLGETAFAKLPACGRGSGGGAIAMLADSPKAGTVWGQVVTGGGGTYKTFVKCDGAHWTTF